MGTAKILVLGKPCGIIGEVHPEIIKLLRIKSPIIIIDLRVKNLYESIKN